MATTPTPSGTRSGLSTRDSAAARTRWVAPLCWAAVALEGFDLVVLGVVLPTLLRDPAWALTPGTAAVISSTGLVGVMVGALAVGPLTDRFGRRRMLLGTVIAFSILTLACAFAAGPFSFGLLRFVAGVPLGGVLPVALAMVNDVSRSAKGGRATTTLMTGYHVGAVLTALLGIAVIPVFGWQAMFVLGALPALVLVPLIALRLPESLPEPSTVEKRRNPVAELFQRGSVGATLAFWVTSFMGLLLVYGLNTWLPEIMRAAGYQLGTSLALLLTLNAGAVVGMLVAGRVADRVGIRAATIAWFVAAAVFLALLSVKLPGIGVFVSVLLAGMFVFSTQVLVYAYICRRYPAAVRATALGSSSGVGRLGAIAGPLMGGALLSAGVAYPWGFFAFALVSVLGAVSVSLVGRARAS